MGDPLYGLDAPLTVTLGVKDDPLHERAVAVNSRVYEVLDRVYRLALLTDKQRRAILSDIHRYKAVCVVNVHARLKPHSFHD